jgi:hypothetical protein
MAAVYIERGEFPKAAELAEQAVGINLEVGARRCAAEASELAAAAWDLAGEISRADRARARATELAVCLGGNFVRVPPPLRPGQPGLGPAGVKVRTALVKLASDDDPLYLGSSFPDPVHS